jgi:hypothetical protein
MLTHEWIESMRTYVMTDVHGSDLLSAFEEGGIDREEMQDWAGRLGAGGAIAFEKNSIRVQVPKRMVPSIVPAPGGGGMGGILRITNGFTSGGGMGSPHGFMQQSILRGF